MSVHLAYVVAFALLVTSWLLFASFFLFEKKPREKATRRERASVVGIALQGTAYAAVWIVRRTWFTPFVPLPGGLDFVPPLLAIALLVLSEWLSMSAVRTLGREWSFEARLVEGHRLVTAGPYRRVRHPIYTGMLGMLVATGIVVSHWIGLLGGLVFFAIGTAIRVRSEERLLREQFGAEYEEYARRVPAVLPRLTG